ncbi:hypothetical protein GCM10017044_19970 [Kordiimonas sediminis]|uniref:Lipopolysaccharide export system permease protein LptF n=1 Tax=Kordiimonas sediminis TaxID=1735581 RepID=A0A919ATE9_9PROT|nr:LPS export ABC transporter permease LptF [Kordiimonas sediminis]GHF25201.1 hypothetical protein GCM10017044_19970 [Kordiimonas sediminis]
MFTLLDRYILKQVMSPMLITFGIAALLLILEKMLKLFDFVVNQGGPVEIVFQMLANLAPRYLGLALPLGFFLGILLAYRKLSLQSEYDALTSAGVSLNRQLRPIMILGVFLAVINTVLVGWIQPESRYAYRGLEFELRSGALGASIRVGEFVELGDDIVLRIEESRNQGAELFGIFLERRDDRSSIAVTAKSGGFFATESDQHILLRLYDGVLVDLNENQNKPRVLTFDEQVLSIKLPEVAVFRERGGEKLEMTLPELWESLDDPERTLEERQDFRGNFHWRIMHSATFLILPFLAIPLGIANKRTGRGAGIPIGVTLVIVYNELMEGMETAITNGISPYLSTWLLFTLFGLFNIWLFRSVAFKAGGDPLSWFDKTFGKVGDYLGGWSKKLMGIKS